MILHFRTVDRALTPLIGLNDSEILKLIELLRENIAVVGPAKPSVPPTATGVNTSIDGNHSNYLRIFYDSVGKFESTVHLYKKDDVTPSKRAPREIPLHVKNNLIAEVQDLQQQGILEKVTEPTEWVSAPAIVNKPSAKNGTRLCIDSRPLNTALKRSECPILTVDHLLTEISNA